MKRVKAKGHTYWYFKTGRTDERGREVLVRTVEPTSLQFGSVYAALVAGKNRRDSKETMLTVPALVELWLLSPKFRTLSAGTRKVYNIYAKRLSALLPTAPATLLEPADIVRLVDKMAATPGAANLFLATTGALFKWARSRNHVSNEPTKGIDALEMGEHEPWPVHLIETALACDDARVRLAVHLLYYTAQRIGDVSALLWSNVGTDRIFFRQQKTGRELEIPIHTALGVELARTPRTGLTVLSNQNGRRVSQDALRASLQTWAIGQGRDVVPHGLRKNAVNALLEAGCSVAETAAISGQSLQLVEHYAKLRDQPKLAGAAILKWEKSR